MRYLCLFLIFFSCKSAIDFKVSEKKAILLLLNAIEKGSIDDVRKLVIFEEGMPFTLGEYKFDQMKPIVENCNVSMAEKLKSLFPQTTTLPDGTIVDTYTVPVEGGDCYDPSVFENVVFEFRFYRQLSVDKVVNFSMNAIQKKFNLPVMPPN